MNFFLANPSWLWLLALGAVPVLVHLFARSRPPKYEFSSTLFLRKIIKKTARFKKPQDWLILLLRTLAVLALLAAFLQPLLTGGSEVVGGKKTTVFVIDRSASMAAKDGGSDAFSEACQEATRLLKSGSIDEANVIWMDALPDGAFPQPGPNLDYLTDLLARARSAPEPTGLTGAIRMGISQLEQSEGTRELVIISDFQAQAWEDFKLETPPGMEVVKVKVGGEAPENLAIESLLTSPAQPVAGQEVTVICRVRNFSETPRRTTLYLDLNGASRSQEVEVPAWGQGEVTFVTRFNSAGAIPVSASLEGDTFGGDNARHSLIEVRETLVLGSVGASAGSAKVLDRLAASLDWLDHRKLDDIPSAGSVDYLFLHQWDGKNAEKLRTYPKAGTAVFAAPVGGVTGSDCLALLAPDSARKQGRLELQTKGQWKAGISAKADATRPIFALFSSGEFGNPAEGIFQSRLQLSKNWPEGIARLLDYRDGVPALLADGRIHLWNLALDPEVSTWAGQAPFVAFMGELLLHSRAVGAVGNTELLPGAPLSWTPPAEISPESLELQRGGETLETSLAMTGQGSELTTADSAVPGLYEWQVSGATVHRQVVNFPSSESDLRSMDPTRVEGGELVDRSSLLRRAALGDGISLWPWLIAAALAFLILESLVSLWKPKPAAA